MIGRGNSSRAGIVTGGASGIGRAVVKKLLDTTERVAVLDNSAESLDRLIESDDLPGERVIPVQCDVTDASAVDYAFEVIEEKLRGADVLVNCVGGCNAGRILDLSARDWSENISVNLTSTFLTCRAFGRLLRSEGRPGSIVNVSSTASQVARPGAAHYAAAKAGVNQLSRGLAIEFADLGIRVNVVCPSVTASQRSLTYAEANPQEESAKLRMMPMARRADPAEIADVVVFLGSPDASFVTGSIVNVDGGYACGIARY